VAGADLAGGTAYLQGKPCPKCAYARTSADRNPAWQCPRCHIAYAKFEPAAPVAARVAAVSREMVADSASDWSVLTLIAANVLAGIAAVVFRMDLRDLMLVYWLQSVIIGASFFARMLSLKGFSTGGLRFNDQPVPETRAGKVKTAVFFLLHYGIFHVGYLAFMLIDTKSPGGLIEVPVIGLLLCGLVFAANHGYSLVHNIRLDRAGRPNLGVMMFLPYARIVPMHFVILAGDRVVGPGAGLLLLLFVGLKTLADVVMHVVEHFVLRSGPRPAA
jgi:hypothetical protein